MTDDYGAHMEPTKIKEMLQIADLSKQTKYNNLRFFA